MSPLLLPFQLVLLMFAGWVNRHHLDVIDYLQEENRVLSGSICGIPLLASRFTGRYRDLRSPCAIRFTNDSVISSARVGTTSHVWACSTRSGIRCCVQNSPCNTKAKPSIRHV